MAMRRALGRRLEAAEAVAHVVVEAGLADLAVVDDVDAGLGLLADDVRDGALRSAASNAASSTGWPLSCACIMSRRSCGRARLPTWVVRMRSVFCCMSVMLLFYRCIR